MQYLLPKLCAFSGCVYIQWNLASYVPSPNLIYYTKTEYMLYKKVINVDLHINTLPFYHVTCMHGTVHELKPAKLTSNWCIFIGFQINRWTPPLHLEVRFDSAQHVWCSRTPRPTATSNGHRFYLPSQVCLNCSMPPLAPQAPYTSRLGSGCWPSRASESTTLAPEACSGVV